MKKAIAIEKKIKKEKKKTSGSAWLCYAQNDLSVKNFQSHLDF